MSRLLLRTLAGSRLYGTAGPDSDWDFYEVYDDIRPRQTPSFHADTIQMPLSKWIMLCEKGTHQALDALWCPPEHAEVDLLTPWRWAVRVDPWRVADQLERTAYSIGGEKHLDRLLHCARRVRERGCYDPTEYGRLV